MTPKQFVRGVCAEKNVLLKVRFEAAKKSDRRIVRRNEESPS